MTAARSPAAASELLPRRLGPLRLERRLGAGGMGAVYAAVLEEDLGALPAGQRVAAKIFRDEAIEESHGLERLRREASVGMRLDHPALVRTHQLLEIDDASVTRHVLVMELVEGTTLRQLLEDLGSLPEPLLRDLALQLARALAAVHALGIVHRDVKPENVLVGADHQVKLSDLGIARPMTAKALTTEGVFLGSVAYASPEHFGAGALSPRSDLYSLGVVLHEAACGRPPFEDPTLAGLVRRHLEQRPRRLGELVMSVSPFVEDLVSVLLEKDPARRMESAAMLADVLEEGERSQWWRARDGGALEARTLRTRHERDSLLVGRESELSALESAARTAFAGAGGILLVEGEAGVGKTRLVEELIDRLSGWTPTPLVLRGENPPGAAGSRGAVAESLAGRFPAAALRRLLERHLAVAPDTVPALEAWALGAPPPAGSFLTREILHAGLARLATGMSADEPIAWIVEDLHFGSVEERSVFATLARAARDRRILVVATTRPGLPADEISALERLGTRRIALQRLSPRAVVDLLAQALGSRRLAEDLGGRVAARTDGNPYFVVEVVRDLQEKGAVRLGDDGAWSAVGRISAIDVPTSVKSLMLERAAALSAGERAVIDAAAVQGFHFDGDLVAEVLGTTRLATLQVLAGIERRTGLVRAAGARYQFDHHQLQEVLVQAVPEPLRIEIHALLASALERRAGSGGPDGEAATILMRHALAGGLLDLAERQFTVAFMHLRRRLENEAAIELATLAMDRLARGTVARSTAGTRLAYTYELIGRSADARAMAEEALRDAEASSDRAASSQAHHALAMVLSRTGQFEGAERSARRGRELGIEAGSVLVATKNLATLGTIMAGQGRMKESIAAFREAADTFAAMGSQGDHAIAIGNLAHALESVGSTEALPLARKSLELALEGGDLLQATFAESTLGGLLAAAGDFDEGIAHLQRSVDRAHSFGLARLACASLERLVGLHVAAGDVPRALESIEATRASNAVQPQDRIEGRLLMHEAELARQGGRIEEARGALAQALALERSSSSPRDAGHVLLAAAALEWTAGSRDRAREHVAAAREIAGGVEDARLQAWCALALGATPPADDVLASHPEVPRIEALAVLAAADCPAHGDRLDSAIDEVARRLSPEARDAFLAIGAGARARVIARA